MISLIHLNIHTQQDNAMIIITQLINIHKLIVLHVTNDVQLRTKYLIQ